MKKVSVLFAFLAAFFLTEVSAQTVDGKVTISGFPKGSTLNEATVVDLFKSFRDGKYKINFSYKADNVNRRGVVLFDMKTTVKLDGKIILQSTRGGWPWLPGDMYVPIEAFDLIPGIQKAGIMPTPKLTPDQMDSPLLKGKYEITLEMVSSSEAVKGRIQPLTFSFFGQYPPQ
ncbi:MAG TPA: hypothetical protein PKM34_00020 [Bacteroidales bacterium]|mgnify:CR=1 FL=1|jgi:hypothetical protein|nr:hypothetical protein [Bacteroidales bacterium]HPG33855.1 hypothetical protein [Lentimicrobium sp.]HPJ77203.1 hypothetical protein [Prolixibacteraceae bacterium]HRV87708.1 hypothetical protein [Prolixibacteraceae bacterium]